MCMQAEGGGGGREMGGVRKRRGSQDSEVQTSSGQTKRNEQFKGLKMFTVGRRSQTGRSEWNLDAGKSIITVFLLCFYEIGS